MSADLHIHILDSAMAELVLPVFFSNSFGSKWFDMTKHYPKWDEAAKIICDTPNMWVGEVSWLKAGLCEDPETFVPEAIQNVEELVGEDLPVIDEAFIQKMSDAMIGVPNKTGYQLSNANDVLQFLETHMGKKVFTVSW